MKTAEALERRIFEDWDNETITLNQFVKRLQLHGWNRDEIYDWLCGVTKGRRPLTRPLAERARYNSPNR